MRIFIVTLFLIISLQSSHSQITWTETNGPLYTHFYNMLFIDETPFLVISDNYRYEEKSILKSDDNGITWNRLNPKIDSVFFREFFVFNNTLYSIAQNAFSWGYYYLYKSTNKGKSWEVDINLGNSGIYNMYISPDQTKYGTNIQRLYRYDGLNQKWIDLGLKLNINEYKFDKKGNIYGCGFDSVIVSKDKGESWTKIYEGKWIYEFVFDINNRMYIRNHSELITSFDEGKSWQKALNSDNITSFRVIDSNNIFITIDYKNLFRIKTSDTLPKKLNVPENEMFYVFYVNPLDNKVYLTNYSVYYNSTDFGESWQSKTQAPVANIFEITAFDNTVLTGYNGFNSYLSMDYGSNWGPVFHNESMKPLYVSSKKIIFFRFYTEGYVNCRKSTDNCKTYSSADTLDYFTPECFVETSKGRLIGKDWMSFRYSDDHLNWTKYDSSENQKVWDSYLSIDHEDNIYSFHGYNDTLTFYKWNPYINENYKKRFITKLGNQYSYRKLVVGNPQQLVFFGNSVLFKSSDDGDTWENITNKFPNVLFTDLITDDAHNFWLGTNKGVFSSTDDGNTWTAYNDGLKDLRIQSLATSRKGFLYLIAKLGKVYKSNIFLGIEDERKPVSGITSSNDGIIDLSFSNSDIENSNINLYNIMGSLISKENYSITKNQNEATIDISGLSPGVYILQCSHPGESFVKTILRY